MIIVKIQGGLGNQMFQYAIAKSLAAHYKTTYAFDHRFLEDRSPAATHTFRNYDLDIFRVKAKRASASNLYLFEHKWPKWKRYCVRLNLLAPHCSYAERHYQFDPGVFSQGPHLYLDGYWQSPKYFSAIAEDLRGDFTFVHKIETQSLPILTQVMTSDSVCINVRRGDFLHNRFHRVCDESFYAKAISIAKEKINHPRFFLFGDDVQWFLDRFDSLTEEITVVDHQHDGYKYGNKLQLMASCKHFIIPNSTFAWWAVWLADCDDAVVIAPSKWFNDPAWDTRDLIPDHWITLP